GVVGRDVDRLGRVVRGVHDSAEERLAAVECVAEEGEPELGEYLLERRALSHGGPPCGGGSLGDADSPGERRGRGTRRGRRARPGLGPASIRSRARTATPLNSHTV